MVNTPIEDYISWIRKAYPDEKTKLFPIPTERLCLYIKYRNITNISPLITYMSSHPTHGDNWLIKIREHPAIIELLNKQIKKTREKNLLRSHSVKPSKEPQCVVVEGAKAKGYMVISKDSSKDNHEINDINTSSGISSNSSGSSSTTLFKKPIPKNSRKRQSSESQLQQERKKKVMMPSIEDKMSDLLSKNKQLKNELEKKNKEIDRLNAIWKQYTKLLKDVPEQDVFVCLEQ
ncbi:hypothetical protein G6F46_002599 [Rhizopus delemar]|nr:hypothetical protein G6F43_001637 [Rhizopus delemar]KAG1550022.1 hypothetical protein G6F51_002711 [Rhizopus arrhizus]KAG1465921.1 hypothetical protein G6F55_000813 [Rhizopus delemar]KAG1504858.1 hypothetical protein G6F54_000723 [Rhizopus delemar]KAG1513085.1 hypothetical protein G6F53_004698 [Rhizopus delemar]